MNNNKLINIALNFYNKLTCNDNDRYLSWEHCYKHFYSSIKNENYDLDALSLSLAFYLASWGMYRGSSFLLQYDYLIHKPAVKIILSEKYKKLLGCSCANMQKNNLINVLFELKEELTKYYEKIRLDCCKKLDKSIPTNNLSLTLVSKIILGTLGCTPAYDRYFCSGLKWVNNNLNLNICKSFNYESINSLCDFVKENQDQITNIQKNMKINNSNIYYSEMKIIDMMFWEIGFEEDK